MNNSVDVSNSPEGWELAQVGDLVDITSGKYIKRSEYSPTRNQPYPVAGAGGPIGWTDKFNFRLPIMTLGRVGAAGSLNTYDRDAWVTDNALVVNPRLRELFRLLGLFFQTVTWSDIQTGSTQPLITQKVVKNLDIPLPPLAEQQRIVAKVEALLERVNQARERLARVPDILKRFRQSVLAAACSGQLTADWREENSDCGSGSDLVRSLHEFHRQQWKRVQKPKKYRPAAQPMIDVEVELPDTWTLASPEELCESIVDCPHSTPKWSEEGEICLRTTNFKPGVLDLSEVRYVSSAIYDERIARLEPKPTDVVYSREGGILGIACMIPDGTKTCLGQRMMLFRTNHDACLPTHLMLILNSPLILGIVREKTGGTASPHLNVGDIRAFPIPLPPLEEQQEIVERVTALFTLADRIEQRLTTATTQTERITQSVLAKAFSGNLVETEADLARREARNYEPASVLLERIT